MPQLCSTNWWPRAHCAKAFWGQHDLPPYQQLLADTVEWADPGPGERWLDLGCGGGALSKALWQRSRGELQRIVGLDCAPINAEAYRQWCANLNPEAAQRIAFVTHDFSAGLSLFADHSFDHAVSGLSLSYAESLDEATGRWTTDSYTRLLGEVNRVLRPGGRFVFSVNVPNPSWGRVARGSWLRLLRHEQPLRALKRGYRMLRYGHWLKREAQNGRFHYLPAAEVRRHLEARGFTHIEHRMSYADQAYIFRAKKCV